MSGPVVGSLFSGYGGLDLAVLEVLGGRVAWHAEIDPAPAKILAHHAPAVPNLGDITAVDWSAVEPIDVLTGGFPCQDLSLAGVRRGLRPGTRSGLWSHMAYAIDQLRPSLVLIENVRGLLSAEAHSDVEPCPWCVGDADGVVLRALGAVLGGLAGLGYDAAWRGVRASDVDASHERFRVFVAAWPAADAERDRRTGWAEAPSIGWADRSGPRAPVARRGADVATDANDAGWIEYGRPFAVRPKQLASEHLGDFASDPGRLRGERRRVHGDVAGPSGAGEADRGERERDGDAPDDRGAVAWGDYEPAIRRWERCLDRPAPSPTEPGKTGQPRLAPAFVEWLMGLPAGWVTDPAIGITRNEQLKALGNGVVPQQAAHALRLLLADRATTLAAVAA